MQRVNIFQMAEPSESRSYLEFVTRSVNEVQRGLKLDSFHPGSKKRKVHATLEAQQKKKRPNRGAAECVIESRFALGGDDASYLASGIATLWSTVGEARDANEAELGLAPASLYAPDAVNGIRKGLLAALERKNEELRREAPRSLPKLLRALQVLLEQIDVTQTPGLKELLKRGTVRTTEEHTMLLTFLMRMREMLRPAQKDNLAQLILTKGRGQVTQLIDRFNKETAALVAEHERRVQELDDKLEGERANWSNFAMEQIDRANNLSGLLAQCEERLRAVGAPPGASGTDDATTQDDPNALAQTTALVEAIAQQFRQQQAARDAQIAANPAAAAALQGVAQPQQQQQAVQDAEIAANSAAADALQGILGGSADPNAPAPAPPTPASRWAQLMAGLGAALQGAQAMAAAAGPATTHTPGTTPPPSPPRSPPGARPLPPTTPTDDDDLVSVAIGRETEFAAWQQQAQATRDELELRIKELDQQLKDMKAVVEADRHSMSASFAGAIGQQGNKLDALRQFEMNWSGVLDEVRNELTESKKAHENLKTRHARQLERLEQGVTDLAEAQRAFTEDVPKLVSDLRAQIDARTADADSIKTFLRTLDGDVKNKASKAVKLQKTEKEVAELKAGLTALKLAQGNAEGRILQEAKEALVAQVAELREEERKRAEAADTADTIGRLHELQKVESGLEAVQAAVKKLEEGTTYAEVLTTLKEDVHRIDTNFATHLSFINSNAADIQTVKDEMTNLQSALETLQALERAKYKEMIAVVAATEGKATDLQTRVMKLFEEVAKLKGNDADNATTVAKLRTELGALREAATARDQRVDQLALEQAALKTAQTRANGNHAHDERFGVIESMLQELGAAVSELAHNQQTLQRDMAYDDQYKTDDFVRHLLFYSKDADNDAESEVKQDLRKMYQSFRSDMEEAEADAIEVAMQECKAAQQEVHLAWTYKDASGKTGREHAKAKLLKEIDSMKAHHLHLLAAWFKGADLRSYMALETVSDYEKAMLGWIGEGFDDWKAYLDKAYPDSGDAADPCYTNFGTGASASDAWTVPYAVVRGLVGQRGPTEPACASECPTDALLPYAAPNLDAFVRHALPVKRLLAHSADPTEEDVAEALKGCVPHVADSPADVGEALALLQDDFAITGLAPASELGPERCGVEVPHEVRWLPQGPRAGTMCRVAVLEHAAARCTQVANRADVAPEVARALRDAAVSLKLQQLAPLYALNESAEFADAPHPLGTQTKLVTRPCAVVRGTLSFPTDAGIARAPKEKEEATKCDDDLSKAMNALVVPTATLRNRLRRSGEPANVYVAPSPYALGFHPAPTKATGAAPDPDYGAAAASEGRIASEANAARVYANRASEAVTQSDYGPAMWRRVVNRAIVAAAAIQPTSESSGTYGQTAAEATRGVQRNAPCVSPDVVSAFLDTNKSDTGGAGAVTAQTRRHGLWTEMLRHVAISQDRLWIFVRLMSGGIGGDVQEVITLANEATLRAAKAIQDQRVEIAKRVSDMQSKIVETVVASMLKKSEMTMSLEDDSVAVIDAEAKKQLHELSSGTSGRPFFEANVALKNLTERNDNPPRLQDVLDRKSVV